MNDPTPEQLAAIRRQSLLNTVSEAQRLALEARDAREAAVASGTITARDRAAYDATYLRAMDVRNKTLAELAQVDAQGGKATLLAKLYGGRPTHSAPAALGATASTIGPSPAPNDPAASGSVAIT